MREYVVRSEYLPGESASPTDDDAIVLSPLGEGPGVRFQCFESEEAARADVAGEVYELVMEVCGPWQDVPSHAVYAIWKIHNPAMVGTFVDSRRQLFEIRRRVLPHFTYDWLLKSLDHPDQFLVLGLYGDEESATRLCREHPDIQQFARANPPSSFEGEDLTGLRCFVVDQHPE